MPGPEDKKPSPVERSAIDNARNLQLASRQRQQRGNLSHDPAAAFSQRSANSSGSPMLIQGTGTLNRSDSSLAEVAAMLSSPKSPVPASSSADLSQLDEIWEKDLNKVSLPDYVKENSTTVTFPEKLMLMLIHIEQVFAASGKKDDQAPIGWTLNGRAFIIRNKEELVQGWLPMFFRQGKFQSFTRKLYRWGFRQVNLPRSTSQEGREFVFANPHFQRDNRGLMAHMKSVTAASLRREQQEKALSESKLPDDQAHPQREGLLSIGRSTLADAILSNPNPAPLQQHVPLALPSLTLADQLRAQSVASLDPVTRRILLGQRDIQGDAGLSLADMLRQQQQQQAAQQLHMPSLAGINLFAPQNFMIPPPVARGPFQSLLESAADPRARLEDFQRERAVQQRLRELAEHFLRNSNNNNGSAGPPS